MKQEKEKCKSSVNGKASNKGYGREDRRSKKPYDKRSKTDKPEDKATSYEDRRGNEVNQYVGQGNSPEWYSKNARLVADASKIPFANQLGRKSGIATPIDGGADIGTVASTYIPGIMALSMVCTPGIASTSGDGANIAAAGLFQFIRKNLSTVATYAPADTMMYVLEHDNVYSMYANILRAFGIINAYSAINLYMPDELLMAGYGFTQAAVDEFKKNINTYRSRFNNLIYKASTLYLPTDFTINSRHAWLFSNYFLDGNTTKSQMYIHRMGLYHMLDETTSTEGTSLVATACPTTMEGLLNAFENMINAIRNSDSMLRIAADMRRAFEGRAQWKLAYCDEAYMVLPITDEYVTEQIHNMTLFPAELASGNNLKQLNVTQSVNKNIILFQPHYLIDAAANPTVMRACVPAMSGKYLNFHKDVVEINDIMEATRDMITMYASKDVVSGKYDLFLMSCSADMCYNAEIYCRNGTDTGYKWSFSGNVIDISKPGNWPLILGCVSDFNRAPMTYLTTSGDTNCYPFFEMDNYTAVTNSVIERLNENIICSMWSIPEFGGFEG